jgi:hypothetical protein
LVKFFISGAESAAFKASKEYKYDLEVFDADGNSTTPVGGGWTEEERVRTATG